MTLLATASEVPDADRLAPPTLVSSVDVAMRRRCIFAFSCALLYTVLFPTAGLSAEIDFDQDGFDKHIRPILSNHCYQCHGPDANHREADLRFDVAESALSEMESGDTAIVPGDPEASELVARIFHDDEYTVMPPPETNKPLSKRQKQLLVDWVKAGAPFAQHWSFVKPMKVAMPEVSNGRVANEIDRFVLHELKDSELSQNEVADRRTLLRRLSLDLIGLPPTPAELQAFESDTSPDAYENQVDRFLASPHYGEQMAKYWLDLVRYGDTHGLHLDNYREMWPYRDWVIESFNENKSYSDFVTEQLAGDLLPNATRDDLVASGYNRLNISTSEGGSIYDEVFVRNNVDRTDAFGTVFLGMTTGCAVCHDHKFDPITQKDFYSLYAFFNSIDGRALDGNKKDHEPVILVPSDKQAAQLRDVEQRVQAALLTLDGPSAPLATAQAEWEALLNEPSQQAEFVHPNDVVWEPLLPSTVSSNTESTLTRDESGLIQVDGAAPASDDYVIQTELPGDEYRGLRLTVEPGENKRVGRSANGNAVISEVTLEVAPAGSDEFRPIKFSAAKASYEQPDGKYGISYAIDGKVARDAGWALGGHIDQDKSRVGTFVAAEPFGFAAGTQVRVTIQQRSQWGQHSIAKFRLDLTKQKPAIADSAPVELSPWHMVGPFEASNVREAISRRYGGEAGKFKAGKVIDYRGEKLTWTEQPEFTDGLVHFVPQINDYASATVLYRSIESPIAQTVKVLADTTDGIRIALNGKDVTKDQTQRSLTPLMTSYDLALKKGKNDVYLKIAHGGLNGDAAFTFAVRSEYTKPSGKLASIASLAPSERSAEDAELLTRFYRRVVSSDPLMNQFRKTYNAVVKERKTITDQIPTTLVFKELETPRPAHILIRGEYDQPGDEVPRATPEALAPMDPSWPKNRLGLAKWLLMEDNPLTSRTAVNRFWQQLFGVGLSKTSEDLGGQGEPPSHLRLLDWLAVDYRENGWNIKRLMKQIVMSETYQQASTIEKAEYAIDPENRLLARGPRHRLDAETLRDQALSIAGLLNDQFGGPSVKPPQPMGLWKAVGYTDSNTANFTPSSGDDIYRRSLYIFWKRTAHAPMMSTLDAPNRESCTARRERTNTPLQALLLMNEQMYVECAIKLAERVMLEIDPADTPSRFAEMFESATGRKPSDAELAVLGKLASDSMKHFNEHPEAAKELLSIGQSTVDDGIDHAALASYTIVANTILNLDEAVTKH